MEAIVTEKPPSCADSANHSSKSRKLAQQTPVTKRQNTPDNLRKARTFDTSTGFLAEDEIKLENEKELIKPINESGLVEKENHTAFNNNKRPNKLNLDMSNTLHPNGINFDNRRSQYVSRRRNTENPPSTESPTTYTCPQHKDGCNCTFKRRHTVTPGVTKEEVMQNETKLIVLEFLSSLSSEKLTARNIETTHKQNKTEGSEISEESEKSKINGENITSNNPDRRSIKWNTITIGENDRMELMKKLREHADEEKKKNGKRLNRSASDVTELNWAETRKKLHEMKVPLRKWMDLHLKHEIVAFDKCQLKAPPKAMSPPRTISPRKGVSPRRYQKGTPPRTHTSTRLSPHKDIASVPVSRHEPASLTIPRRSVQLLQDTDIFTPETAAVNRLEQISKEIIRDYPEFLNKPISKLLLPLNKNKLISYDTFSSIAKSVYEKNFPQVSGSAWARIALVLYMVKETMFLGNLNDTQVELMVEHSTQFFSENVKESDGGWDALEESMMYYNEFDSDIDDISEEETKNEKRVRKISKQQAYRDSSLKEKLQQTVNNWTPYAMAALAVGLGLAYSYLKT